MEPTTFAELSLSAKVLEAITASGYITPTPIQAQAIPVAMTGRDVLGIAQTGTGKTAAFVMPMISRLETGRARARMPRSLILLPTRELATQVAQSFEKYGQNHKLAVALLIGGVSMDDQVAKLDRGVDVLIATPGRLLDHFGRGRVMLMGVEILVIDEADRMLDMGFIPDIEKICKLLPPRRQTLFFSATMPPEITRLVDQFLNDPTRIEVAKPATTAKTIQQSFLFCPDGEDYTKREALRGMIKAENVKNAIIFCNRKRDVAILHKSLVKHGFNAGALHGDMDQMSRTATLDKFRAGEITILAASDVAARGLDIPEVSHVFNFDVPWQADDYVHRIGRTGRAGREGFSATLVTYEDFKAIKDIEKLIGEAPTWIGEPPTEADLTEGAKRKRSRGGKAPAGRGGRPGSDGRRDAPRGAALGVAKPSKDGRRGSHSDRGSKPALIPPGTPPGDVAVDEAMAIAAVADTVPGTDAPASNRDRSRNRRTRAGDGGRRDGARPQRDGSGSPRVPQRRVASLPQEAAPQHPGHGDQPIIDAGSEPRDLPERKTKDARQPREARAGGPRPPRQDRGDRPARAEQPPRQERQPRADQRSSEDRQPREAPQPRDAQQPRDAHRPREDRPLQAADAPFNPNHKRVHRRDDSGPRVGFEDNVPAFLKKPVRAPG